MQKKPPECARKLENSCLLSRVNSTDILYSFLNGKLFKRALMERSLSLTLHLCESLTNSFEDCDKFLELKTSDEFWKLVQKVLS